MGGRGWTVRVGRCVWLGALLIAMSCSGGAPDADDAVGEAPEAADVAQDQPVEVPAEEDQEAGGVCAALQTVDLDAAFAGALEFGAREERSELVCVVPVEGAEGEGLIVQVSTPGNYEAKAQYEDQEGIPFEWIEGLGQEAFLANEADLNVLVDDETALQVGISAFFTEGQVPEADVLKAGLTELARVVLAGL